MKKIFYLTIFLLTFISCTSNYKTTTTRTTIDHVEILNVEGYSRIKIIDIEHNGHDYIIFDCYETMVIEHSPECKKCKSKSNYTPTEYLY